MAEKWDIGYQRQPEWFKDLGGIQGIGKKYPELFSEEALKNIEKESGGVLQPVAIKEHLTLWGNTASHLSTAVEKEGESKDVKLGYEAVEKGNQYLEDVYSRFKSGELTKSEAVYSFDRFMQFPFEDQAHWEAKPPRFLGASDSRTDENAQLYYSTGQATQARGLHAYTPGGYLKKQYADLGPTREPSFFKKYAIPALFGLATGGAGLGVSALMGGLTGATNQGTQKGSSGMDWLKGGLTGALAGAGGGLVSGAIGAAGAGAVGAGGVGGAGGIGPLGQYLSGGSALAGNTAGAGFASSWVPGAIAGATGASSGYGPLIDNLISQYGSGAGGVNNLDYSPLAQDLLNSQGGNNMASVFGDNPLSYQDLINQVTQNVWPSAEGGGAFDWMNTIMPNMSQTDVLSQLTSLGGEGGGSILSQLQKLLGQGGGDQAGQTGLQGLLGGLGDIYQGMGGAGTAIPLAMLAYLNQKDYNYPSPSAVQWPSWMEQMREETMGQSQDYFDQAGGALSGLLGADPTADIMAATRGGQDIDYQKWLKQIKPTLAAAGNLDSTYGANAMGEPLLDFASQNKLLEAQLGLQVPQMQAGFAGQLANLGQQQGQVGQGWFDQGKGWTLMNEAPGQQGFNLEYQKVAGREEADQQLASLMGMLAMGNMFPQNPVLNPSWGTGQTGQQPWGSISANGGQSDLQKLLGYGQTGLNVAQTGKGLWDVGSSILNWF